MNPHCSAAPKSKEVVERDPRADLDDFRLTYQAHCMRRGGTPRHNPTHRCRRGACRFWGHPRAPLLYMCEESSIVHVCGKYCDCDPIETEESELVCPFTGMVMAARVAARVFADGGRTLTPTEYDPGEQRRGRWGKWETTSLNTLKKILKDARDVHDGRFVSACLVIYERILKNKTAFFCNRVQEFCDFCLATAYLCKSGIPKAGIPILPCVRSFPDPRELPNLKVNLTRFNKTVRCIVKLSQKENARALFSPLRDAVY